MPVTFQDKDNTLPTSDPRKLIRAVDVNELKQVINATEAVANAVDASLDAVLASAPSEYNTFLEVGNKLTSLDSLKAPIASPTFTGLVTTPLIKITSGSPGAGKVLTSDADGDATWETPSAGTTIDTVPTNGSTNAVQSNGVFDELALKAPIASPTFTGTVSGITKSMVGLNLVDNTSDAGKPVSTAQQTALDLKLTKTDDVWGEVPTGTVNGVNDTFTIANANPSKKALYLDGIRTNPSNFSITGTTLTVTNAQVIPTNSILIDYVK